MQKYVAAAAALSFVMVGCAKPPEAITASYASDVPYRGWACADLGEEQIRLSQALSTASMQQSQTRSNDVVGVIFLGLPTGSMSGGNIAPEIARLKGEIEAVNRAQRIKGCAAAAVVTAPVVSSTPAATTPAAAASVTAVKPNPPVVSKPVGAPR